MSLVEVVGVCVALVVVVVLVFVVFDFVVFCIFIMMTKTETRAAAMTAPPGIVDGHLVAAGEVTFLDTLLPESQGPTANHSPETISPSQPEEMPPLAPPSAEVGCTPKTPSPPPKAPRQPLFDSNQRDAMKAVIIAKNEELRYKEKIIKGMDQELKKKLSLIHI